MTAPTKIPTVTTRSSRRSTAPWVVIGIALASLALWNLGAAQTTAAEAAATLALVPNASGLVRDGAILYDHNCSACHGDTGQGLAEAKTSFPEDKRNCTSCHRPSNPAQMDHLAMNWRFAFDVGVAPAVIGDGALSAFGTGTALFGYIRLTMPRPWPDSLTSDEYLRITTFLAAANGADAVRVRTVDDLSHVEIRETVP